MPDLSDMRPAPTATGTSLGKIQAVNGENTHSISTGVSSITDTVASLPQLSVFGGNGDACATVSACPDRIISAKESANNGQVSSQSDSTGVCQQITFGDLQFDFFDFDVIKATVRILQPPVIDAQTFFNKDSFSFKFRTGCPQFLAKYQANEESWFEWNVVLAGEVIPEECALRIQNKKLELTLRKARANEKWQSLVKIVKRTSFASPPTPPPPPYGAIALPAPPPYNVSLKPRNSLDEENEVPESSASYVPGGGYQSKPTCKVGPYNEKGMNVIPGFTGLRNMGNTCFLNSVLQVLINTTELKNYFLHDLYKPEVNPSNPLGMKGDLAEAFALLMCDMWSGMKDVVEPAEIKSIVATKAHQFANFAQHDAQEFLSFLLDGLHEDLNRVKNKPYTTTVESNGRPDEVVAAEAWETYGLRNDSFIVDLFHGQYRSHVQCPVCSRESVTFDPFVYLSIPFPRTLKKFNIYYFTAVTSAIPIRYTIPIREDATVRDFLEAIATRTKSKASLLHLADIFNRKVWKNFSPQEQISSVQSNDVLFVYVILQWGFEALDPAQAGEDILNLWVLQRLLHPEKSIYIIPKCDHCGKKDNLSCCLRCYRVFYCNADCQKGDWPRHRMFCSREKNPELVGNPFMISVPASKATYRRLQEMIEGRLKYSVEVFQYPVDNPALLKEEEEQQQEGGSVGTSHSESLTPPSKVFQPEPNDEQDMPLSPPESGGGSGSGLDENEISSSSITLTPAASGTSSSESDGGDDGRRGSGGEPFYQDLLEGEDGSDPEDPCTLRSTPGFYRSIANAPAMAGLRLRLNAENSSSSQSEPHNGLDVGAFNDERLFPTSNVVTMDTSNSACGSPQPTSPLTTPEPIPRSLSADDVPSLSTPMTWFKGLEWPSGPRKSSGKDPTGILQCDYPASEPSSSTNDLSENQPAVNEVETEDSTCDAAPGAHDSEQPVRLVFGEPRSRQWTTALFYICRTNRNGETLTHQDRIASKEDEEPMDLRDGEYLAIDWRNKRSGRDFLKVANVEPTDTASRPPVDLVYAMSTDETEVQVSKILKIENLLELFTQAETLSADEAWYCDRCKEHREARKQLYLWKLPPILVIQLKRFQYNSGSVLRNKIERQALYPKILDMAPYVSERSPEKTKGQYELYGIVCHIGTSYFGHYVSYGRCYGDTPDKTECAWRYFDDSRVTYANETQYMNNKDAYLLLYRRRDLSTAEAMSYYCNTMISGEGCESSEEGDEDDYVTPSESIEGAQSDPDENLGLLVDERSATQS